MAREAAAPVWMGIALVPAMAWLIYRTPFGLRLRAVGEHPEAAAAVGVPVERVRYMAVALSGVLAALGGVYPALDQHQFTDWMTAGRGFIAPAAVIFGRWDARGAALAYLFFTAAETLQIQLQTLEAVPSHFVAIIPYVLTIVALAGLVGRAGHRPRSGRRRSGGNAGSESASKPPPRKAGAFGFCALRAGGPGGPHPARPSRPSPTNSVGEGTQGEH